MKILSVQQPWAWALIHGPKRIENRTWPTSYRGPLLIHAGKSRQRLGDEGDAFRTPQGLDFGAVIGVVDLADCVPYHDACRQDFAEGPWCWITANPRPISPILWRGSLGIQPAPQALLDLLPAEYRAEPLAIDVSIVR